MTEPTGEKRYTLAQVAIMLEVSPQRVQQMIERDQISGHWQSVSDALGRPGWRYTEAEIERVKAARAANPRCRKASADAEITLRDSQRAMDRYGERAAQQGTRRGGLSAHQPASPHPRPCGLPRGRYGIEGPYRRRGPSRFECVLMRALWIGAAVIAARIVVGLMVHR